MLARCKRGTAASATSAARGAMGKPASQRNGRCTVYRSTRLTVLVQQHFTEEGRQATLIGKGSVAHTEGVSKVVLRDHAHCGTHTVPVPEAYQLDPEANVNLEMGENVVWCSACRVWVFTDGWAIRKFFPSKPRLGTKSYEGVFGIGGNAAVGRY